VKSNSYEHDEHGITTEEIPLIKAMQDKRFAKSKGLAAEMRSYDTVKIHGDEKSKLAIVCFGSMKTQLLEAMKQLEKPVKLVQIVWLEPFDAERVSQALTGAEKVVSVENNHAGQLAGLIREKTGIEITNRVLKYDSKPFSPLELAEELTRVFS